MSSSSYKTFISSRQPYLLENHACSRCRSRLLRKVQEATITKWRGPAFVCSGCGAKTNERKPDAICWCGRSGFVCLNVLEVETFQMEDVMRAGKICGFHDALHVVGVCLEDLHSKNRKRHA